MSDPAAYFAALSAALDRAGIAEAVLVIDRQRLDANIAAVAATLRGSAGVRLVVKSLPSAPLLHHLSAQLGTSRYMVFNRAMLREMRAIDPAADLLLGKPLPVAAAAAYYGEAGTDGPGPCWLIVASPCPMTTCTPPRAAPPSGLPSMAASPHASLWPTRPGPRPRRCCPN